MTYIAPQPMHDIGPQSWRAQASCAEVDSELFFPEKGISNRPALRICAGCPVALDCLRWALAQDQRVVGIWGGTSEADRRKMRPSGSGVKSLRRLEPCGTDGAARRHRSRGEPICEACRIAAARASQARKQARKRATT